MKKFIAAIILLTNLNSFSLNEIEMTRLSLSTTFLPLNLAKLTVKETSKFKDEKALIVELKSQSTRYIEFGETTDTLERIFEANPEKSEIEVVENILDL